ncbi:hypothetical protein HN51_055716 [Arachis hypogaea]|uniref:Serine/threonine-protein kinase n=1 Tax=Arachis hypogaea TaxID=3818 RepID=A0A6B9VAS8_ARAHY|nr:uncharacterized protein LOC107619554 [Arachis ipaensis]XP_025677409.1 uncharacterized protein LOC112777288 [Arachis hypogaea]QHN78503.1 Serine/threonine-protein kinase [Arachis hypogaea]
MSNEAHGNSGAGHKETVFVGSGERIPSDIDVDNVCILTGEEFSADFLRDRVGFRRLPIITDADQRLPNRTDFNINNNYQMVHEDLNHGFGLIRSESDCNSDMSEYYVPRGYVAEVDNRTYPNNFNVLHFDPGGSRQVSGQLSRQGSGHFSRQGSGHFSRQVSGKFTRQLSGKVLEGGCCDRVYVVDSPQSSHAYGTAFSEGFFNKIKFLCSFGGRILPRPNDGKLRYMGGETRIISIRKNITWEELMSKTSAICNQTHTIRYQLPGEDLDALISVCSDEDLHHMIEEYEELERAGGSNRLRIFLIPLTEAETPGSNEARVNQASDTDYHYVVAVNGMHNPSPRRNPSGQNLASPFGNNSDYNSPGFHRDSHPAAFTLEAKDCNPTTTNMPGQSPKPSQFLTAMQVASKFNQMPSLSPSFLQPKDPKISDVQHFMDHPCIAVNESILPFVMEKAPHDNSLYTENTNYVDPIAYYNNHGQGPPYVNYHPINQYTVDADQFRKPSDNFHFHRRTHSNELLYSAISGQNDMIFERPSVTNEGSYHFDKIVSHPHKSSLLPVCDDRAGPHYRMLHVNSESSLLESEENLKVHLQFPPSVERDKLISPETSSHLEECPSQPRVDWQEHEPKYHNLPISGMSHCRKGLTHIGKENLQHVGKNNAQFDEQCINYQHGFCSSSPDLQSSECNVSVAPFSSLESPRNWRDQPHGAPLDRTASEFSIRSQDSSLHNQYATPEADNRPLSLVSFELQPIDSHASQESVLPISYPVMSASSMKEVAIPHEDPDYKEGSTDINKESSRSINDCSSTGFRSCTQVASNLDKEDEVASASPTQERVDGLVNTDSENINKPPGDTTPETEAEQFGLQIIENIDLEELQELGSGTFGTVYLGKWRGTDVAIKRIKKSSCFSGRLSEQERMTKDFWREAQILSTLHHPNVVAFYGVVPNGPDGTLATVTEYMVHGSLRNVLVKKERVLDRRKRIMIAMDAAFGMEYLHLKNIVHFDLKCDNLLVNLGDPERPVCKVSDFGLSRIKRNTLISGGVRGTLPWMAPELLDGNNRVSEKVDVFSFGIAMWEILTGEEPYANMHCGAIIGGIVNNTLRPSIPKRCDSEWKKLMEECWNPDPEVRPSFTEIKNRLRSMSVALQNKRHIR